MRDTTVASRYAKALFLVTERRQETPRALEDLRSVHALLKPGTAAGGFFSSPEVRMADKRQALRRVFDGHALPIVIVFVDLLLRKTRLREFTTILQEFQDLVEHSQGIQRAHVVSAVPLTQEELNRLVPELERVTHGKIRMTTDIDPGVVGGVLVRIGDRVIDRTVKTLLEAISKQLYEASV